MRRVVHAVGELLITVGLVLLLFCGYELWFTGLVTARAQDALASELQREWTAPRAQTTPADLGDAFARMHVPRFGAGWSRVVVEGVSTENLKKGPGHYPGTALPGEVGNTVLSGHRTTYGAPFHRLDELQPGDPVVLETRTGWSTYRVTGREVVAPTATEVLLPVPGEPGARPTEPLLTLTTCHPKYSARERLVVTGRLEATTPRAAGPPAVLGGEGR